MTDYSFHGQTIKEVYRDDIEESRKQLTAHKLWEFFDDHSYGRSKKMGMLIYEDDGDRSLALFMEYGPQKKEDMAKLLEWRRSGESDEIGHKGGGNKRNIFTMVSWFDVTLLTNYKMEGFNGKHKSK